METCHRRERKIRNWLASFSCIFLSLLLTKCDWIFCFKKKNVNQLQQFHSATTFMFVHSHSPSLGLFLLSCLEKQMEGRWCTWGNKYLSILIINQLQKKNFSPIMMRNSHFYIFFCRERSICGHDSSFSVITLRIEHNLKFLDIAPA